MILISILQQECSNNTDFMDPGENGENMVMPRSQQKLASGRPRILSPFEGFLLMLCRLRCALTIRHHSFLFSASTGAVKLHFFMWFSKETVVANMPKSMKEKYPNTRVIIDCTEFYAENPSKLSLQKMFYSSYKSP